MKNSSTSTRMMVLATLAVGSPAWAVGVTVNGPAREQPEVSSIVDALPAADDSAPGSGALVPLVAADVPAMQSSFIDASTPASGGADKLVDDIAFVARATTTAYEDIEAARHALPQLKDPELKRLANTLAEERATANERLARIAEQKTWPTPSQPRSPSPPAGTASADFDASWTDDMIVSHERSLALFSAQAQAGEDRELRKYARDMLPTLQHHLAELRRLQK